MVRCLAGQISASLLVVARTKNSALKKAQLHGAIRLWRISPLPPPSPLSLPCPLPSSPPLLEGEEKVLCVSIDLKKLEWERGRIRNVVGEQETSPLRNC